VPGSIDGANGKNPPQNKKVKNLQLHHHLHYRPKDKGVQHWSSRHRMHKLDGFELCKGFKAFQVWNDSYDTQDNEFLTK
jgi:hypothetical protein